MHEVGERVQRLLELLRLRDEVGLAVQLDERRDAVRHQVAISPSAATRPAFLAAAARPFLRRIFSASSAFPFVSSSALLQSSMPAPVLSRSILTITAEIAMASSLTSKRPAGTPSPPPARIAWIGIRLDGNGGAFGLGRARLGHLEVRGHRLVLAVDDLADEALFLRVQALEHRVRDLAGEELDRADGVVVPGITKLMSSGSQFVSTIATTGMPSFFASWTAIASFLGSDHETGCPGALPFP